MFRIYIGNRFQGRWVGWETCSQSVVRIKDEESGAERSFRGMGAKCKIAQSRAKSYNEILKKIQIILSILLLVEHISMLLLKAQDFIVMTLVL